MPVMSTSLRTLHMHVTVYVTVYIYTYVIMHLFDRRTWHGMAAAVHFQLLQ